jgi:hypothetical protein
MKALLTLSILSSLMLAQSVPAMAKDPEQHPPCLKCGPGHNGNGAIVGDNGVTVQTGNGDQITVNRTDNNPPPVSINGCEPGTDDICEVIP